MPTLLTLIATTALRAQQPASPRLPCTVSWLGNSFPGAQKWVQQDIRGLFVTPDGAVYTNVYWDEAGAEVTMYRGGEVLAVARHTHGWGYHGGKAVAVNSKYVYFAQHVENEGGELNDLSTWPPKGSDWDGVGRRLRADLTQTAPFAGSKGGKGDTLAGGFLMVNEVPNKTPAGIAGLWATDERLYVSNPYASEVRVYDAESMAPVTTWQVERPGQMGVDRAGALWIVQAGLQEEPARLIRRSVEGKALPQKIILPADTVPGTICFDVAGRLLVADRGPRSQVLAYDNVTTKPTEGKAFGVTGGLFAGPIIGKVGDLRLNAPTAVGCDATGNVYVANDGNSGGGGTVLESYTPAGKLNWRLFGLEFVDVADIDPQSDADVFTKGEHFRMDDAKPAGSEWSYVGYTVNPHKYPEDPRLHLWSAGAWIRRLAGQRFLFVTDMNAQWLQVYRFSPRTDGETAIPCALFTGRHIDQDTGWPPHQPDKGEWLWRDANANGAFDAGEYRTNEGNNAPGYQGWWVDGAGNVWQASETNGIRKFPLDAVTQAGCPTWSFATSVAYPKPPQFEQVKRLRYYPDTDAMYLGGTTPEHKNQHWKPMGPVLCRYDDWTGNRTLRWQLVAPSAEGSTGHTSCEPMGFDIAATTFSPPTPAPPRKSASAPATPRSSAQPTAPPSATSSPQKRLAKSASRTSANA